jgi:hypothetical protein
MFRTKKPSARVHEGYVPPETEVYEVSLTDLFHAQVKEHRDELPKSTVGKLLRHILADEEKVNAPEISPPSPN